MKAVAQTLIAASIALAIGCGVPYFDGEVESVSPHHIVVIPAVSGTAELFSQPIPAFVENVADCAAGLGHATALIPQEDDWQGREVDIPCEELEVAAPEDLRRAFEGPGYLSGSGPIRSNPKPLTASKSYRGYSRLGRGTHVTYFVRYNDTHIRLVRWSHGNRWGIEVEHTYALESSPRGIRVVTVKSEARQAALEWFPAL